jgi:hypothetical protein
MTSGQCTEHEMKAGERAGRTYLVLWKWSEAERINGSVISRGESHELPSPLAGSASGFVVVWGVDLRHPISLADASL